MRCYGLVYALLRARTLLWANVRISNSFGRDVALETASSKGSHMNLTIWLPAMFLLGIVSMVLCVLFLNACEKM